jgi:hypothetical protein
VVNASVTNVCRFPRLLLCLIGGDLRHDARERLAEARVAAERSRGVDDRLRNLACRLIELGILLGPDEPISQRFGLFLDRPSQEVLA